jgi:hypothetical protein
MNQIGVAAAFEMGALIVHGSTSTVAWMGGRGRRRRPTVVDIGPSVLRQARGKSARSPKRQCRIHASGIYLTPRRLAKRALPIGSTLTVFGQSHHKPSLRRHSIQSSVRDPRPFQTARSGRPTAPNLRPAAGV